MIDGSSLWMPSFFSEGMVLQQGLNTRLWGRAKPSSSFEFSIQDARIAVQTDASGSWLVTLPPLKPGGPFTLYLDGESLISRLWVGDLWLCSGQSNMERDLASCADWPSDAEKYRGNPNIRQLCVPLQYNFQEAQEDLPGAFWIGADSDRIGKFSAAAYHFAAEIYTSQKIPIGLVLNAVGGSPAQAWLGKEALRRFPRHLAEAERCADQELVASIQTGEDRREQEWYGNLLKLDPNDPKRAGDPSKDWNPSTVPGLWKDSPIGDWIGSLWFRRDFFVDKEHEGRAARLRLGAIVDGDQCFVNGISVGSTGYQYPARRYEVPAGILKAGSNTLLAQIVAPRGGGGFVPDKPYRLEYDDGGLTDLRGQWEWRQGAASRILAERIFLQYKPLGLMNGMLKPLAQMAIKGVLWYQGESNTNTPKEWNEYEALFISLIEAWRSLFNNAELPFLFVQLPLFGKATVKIEDGGWPRVREAQRRALKLPATGMAVALDLGEWNDLHPRNKLDVGKRLALLARRLVYKEDIELYSGPIAKALLREGKRLRVSFEQAGEALCTTDGKAPDHLYVCGRDKNYRRAEARIEGRELIVWNETVAEPMAVRYAWASNPDKANLRNAIGLPASPFELELQETLKNR